MPGISYKQERDHEQLRRLDITIGAFAVGYKPNRPTVILLPGGMGSSLLRANGAFAPGSPPHDFSYDALWVALRLLYDAADLTMAGDVDAQQHPMITDGQIKLLGIGPYDAFEIWGRANGYNVLLYGWDWRRRLDDEAAFFGNIFLPRLRASVLAACHLDPLADLTVVGHSFGGLLLHLWLQGGGPVVGALRNAVTVATPFYGYGGQVHRYFAGEAMLKDFYSCSTMAAIIASLRGPYELMFMPHAIWLRDEAVFAADDFPLVAYPSMDAAAPALPADPYNPVGAGGNVRYPTAAWFQAGELPVASTLMQAVTAPLPAAVAAKTHNWRGVRTVGTTVLNDTVWRQSWELITPGFDPDTDDDPITDHSGPGDDTIPAWSARLASTPPENLFTFGGSLNHMFMMGNAEVLAKLAALIGPPVGPMSALDIHPMDQALASREETLAFLKAIRVPQHEADTDEARTRHIGQVLRKTEPVRLQAVIRRFMADLLKR